MLCVRVTRNVVNRPKRTCCERPALGIVNPMIKVAMKQTMEMSAEVSKSKTIEDFTATRWCALQICMVMFLSAGGQRKVRVEIPQPSPVAPTELEGLATYYAEPNNGRRTASGEIFDRSEEHTSE